MGLHLKIKAWTEPCTNQMDHIFGPPLFLSAYFSVNLNITQNTRYDVNNVTNKIKGSSPEKGRQILPSFQMQSDRFSWLQLSHQ